jgi:hypothetical protein
MVDSITLLFEVDLPGWLAVPLPQTLAPHVEAFGVRRIEYED